MSYLIVILPSFDVISENDTTHYEKHVDLVLFISWDIQHYITKFLSNYCIMVHIHHHLFQDI